MEQLGTAWLLLLLPLLPPLTKGEEDHWISSACGQQILKNQVNERIVGGKNAREGAWPWQASLRQNQAHICGATLISNSWVLTAAHCFQQPFKVSQFHVVFGELQLFSTPGHSISRSLSQVILHPDYSGEDASNGDIALLKLAQPLDFSPWILPACLPEAYNTFHTNVTCTVTGWGKVEENVQLSPPYPLQEAKLPLIGAEDCDKIMNSNSHKVTNKMVCAGFMSGGVDSCQGDSGGPLVCPSLGSWFLVGIVSWGIGCAQPRKPGVYTLVSAYGDWIQSYASEVQLGNHSIQVWNAAVTQTHGLHLSSLLLVLWTLANSC
ncbi:serine protease 33-like [Notamacropus eugenii]|uniref:serine protease 33-like n=1 Tax=Notamacropus eugenii TaxID=9315 RepID=UPI003B67AE7D